MVQSGKHNQSHYKGNKGSPDEMSMKILVLQRTCTISLQNIGIYLCPLSPISSLKEVNVPS